MKIVDEDAASYFDRHLAKELTDLLILLTDREIKRTYIVEDALDSI